MGSDNNAKNDIDGDGNGDCDSYTDSDTIIGSGSGSDSNDSDMDGDFVINGDSDMDSDDNMDSGIDGKSNIDVDYDSDSGTDDDCEAGTNKTKSILYRHISIIVVRNPIPEKANIVLVKITLLHTKGEDNRPQVKSFVIKEEDDPLLCLLGHILSLTCHNNAFASKPMQDIDNIYRIQIPVGKKSITLKWESSMLDIPIFRQPTSSLNGYGTSATEPLRSSTWIRYTKQLGLKSGLEHSFTQYVVRRGLCNAVNNKAPASVRDQIMDHHSNTVRYYLDQEVRFNTQAAFLGRPSDEAVQKVARLMSLTVDPTAPTELSAEQSRKLANHPRVVRLQRKSKALTAKIRMRKYSSIEEARGTELYKQKRQADTALSCARTELRARLIKKARKRHFRNADTLELNAQFADSSFREPSKNATRPERKVYEVAERDLVIQLTCDSVAPLTDHEKLTRRINAIKARAALCNRQESQRRGRRKSISKQDEVEDTPKARTEPFPEICEPTQCPICIGNEAKSYRERSRRLCNVNKMRDHVECHLRVLAPGQKIPCGVCKARRLTKVLPNKQSFKNHVAMVHKITLRP